VSSIMAWAHLTYLTTAPCQCGHLLNNMMQTAASAVRVHASHFTAAASESPECILCHMHSPPTRLQTR
jgi:hypothetical protein